MAQQPRSRSLARRALRLAPLLSLLAACTGGKEPACRAGSDCASGVCRSNGTCQAPAVDAGHVIDLGPFPDGGSDGGQPDAGQAPDGGSPDAGQPDAGPVTCRPDGDDTVSRSEVVFQAGLRATFRIATNAQLDSAGTTLTDGGLLWDLTGSLSGDHDSLVTTDAVAGAWYANDFAGATYASRLTESSDLLGVFQATQDALLLMGVVSPTNDAGYTELTYSPPVTVLQFPIQPGATWSTNATVSGIASGFAAYYYESYDSEVDKQGELLAPFANFPVLRVRTDLTRNVGGLVTTRRTFTFATDCFGAVAVIQSQDDELQSEFTSAAEVRRLAP